MSDTRNLSERLGRFGAWWVGELAALAPAPLRRKLRGDCFTLSVDSAGVFTLHAPDGAELYQGSGDGVAAIAEASQGAPRFILRLPSEAALVRTFQAPAKAGSELRSIAAFEIESETPFRLDEVLFDVAVSPDASDGGVLTVRQVIVAHARVEQYLRAAGLDAGAVVAVEVAGIEGVTLGVQRKIGRGARRAVLRFAMVASAACLMVIAINVRQGREIDRLLEQVETLESETRDVRAAAREAQAAYASAAALKSAVDDDPLLTNVLAQLTGAMSDEAWLERLVVSDRTITIGGYARSAAALITALESDPAFENVRIAAPISPDAASGSERFELQLNLAAPEAG